MDRRTVLVVDDTEANVDILVEALSADYEVSVAMDGLDALESVGDEPPDLVLLDIMMPEMDGYEVCRRLKADDATKNIPVIFITGLNDEESTGKGLELGAVDYITKPFNSSEVIGKVKKYI
tara:strand:+ start:806 stop:1168 length:363 start_codon:yes stop_codon:yes gene_type:complete